MYTCYVSFKFFYCLEVVYTRAPLAKLFFFFYFHPTLGCCPRPMIGGWNIFVYINWCPLQSSSSSGFTSSMIFSFSNNILPARGIANYKVENEQKLITLTFKEGGKENYHPFFIIFLFFFLFFIMFPVILSRSFSFMNLSTMSNYLFLPVCICIQFWK